MIPNQQLLHCLPPETIHALGLFALRLGILPSSRQDSFASLRVEALGLSFPNPVGLAAGFDKNAVAVKGLLKQGFGFVEAGTVTPLPQSGNPMPRIFRLIEDEAVINRLGFNNEGLSTFIKNLEARKISAGIVGANIGKNKYAPDAVADYVQGFVAVYPYADYITVNISSPNTEGLRSLQKREALKALLTALHDTHVGCTKAHGKRIPLLVKVAPDLDQNEREDIAYLVLEHEVDGLIISNTTLSRPDSLQNACKSEQGGLSGKPLFALSTESLASFYKLTGGKITLIGVGGISSAEDAYKKIRNGATLVQLYTALVYQGFGVVREIQKGLAELLARDGFTNVQQAVGVDVK
jgi:dihydroorotate dehydrogenase